MRTYICVKWLLSPMVVVIHTAVWCARKRIRCIYRSYITFMGRCVYIYILIYKGHITQHHHPLTTHIAHHNFHLTLLHKFQQVTNLSEWKIFHVDKNIYLYNWTSRILYRIFIINKKIMKSLSAFLASCIIWYAIISFITFNVHVDTWHWSARASLVLLSLLTWDRIDKNI